MSHPCACDMTPAAPFDGGSDKPSDGFALDAARDPHAALLMAHGAGAPMDSAWMTQLSSRLAAEGLSVLRFEFAFMAGRRQDGKRRPAPHADKLLGAFAERVTAARALMGDLPLLIGGKSLGGRVASMLCARGTLAAQVPSDTEMATADAATSAVDAAAVTGFVCFGYPFHPRGKPETLRIAHLAELQVPGLILQGTRDPLGNRDDVAGYEMSPGITVRWLEDGDHDFAPRKRSGITLDAHLTRAAREVSAFAHRVSNQR